MSMVRLISGRLFRRCLLLCLALLCGTLSLTWASDKTRGVNPRLVKFAVAQGLRITSGRGGRHNWNSKHYKGLAIDVSCRTMSSVRVLHLKRAAKKAGLRLVDERRRPRGQRVWSSAH